MKKYIIFKRYLSLNLIAKSVISLLFLVMSTMTGYTFADNHLPPTVSQTDQTKHPAIPSNLKVTCLNQTTCPVIMWEGITYWPYSYIDNRYSIAVVGYDLSGKVVTNFEVKGTRYVTNATVNATAKTVTFIGQQNSQATVTFDQLAVNESQLGPSVTAGRTLKTSDMTNTFPKVPADIYRPSASKGASQSDLATFAWLEFIALSSPVGPLRGGPGGSFAESGAVQDATLVWETYSHRSELLPFNPSGTPVAPNPWNNTPVYKLNKKINDKAVLPYTPNFSNYNNLDEASQIGQNIIFFPNEPGNPQPETDGQLAFEAKVNYYEWAYVNENYQTLPGKLFNSDPSKKEAIDFPDNTLEVKAAWRPLSSIPENKRYRYHTTEAIIYEGDDEAPEAKVATYALVGLHIIQKTPNYPTFVFATFQHVDNLGADAFQPPEFDSTVTRTFAGRSVNYSNIKINGTAHSGNTLEVAPGANVSVNLDWASQYTSQYCPGCIQQFYIGVKDEAIDCMYNGQTRSPKSGSGSFSFKAPSKPGVYPIQVASSLQYSCTLGDANLTDSQQGAIGFVVVAEPNSDTGLYYLPAYSSPEYSLPTNSKSFKGGKDGFKNPLPLAVKAGVDFDVNDPKAAPNGHLYSLPTGSVANIPGAKTVPVSGGKTVVAVPVKQPATVSNHVADVNQQALAAMKGIPGFSDKFVWQYYQLKGVQGVPSDDESIEDFYLANNVVESSQPTIQLFRGGLGAAGQNPRNQTNIFDEKQNKHFVMGGCQGCHGVAQTKNGFDFSFLFFGAGGTGFSVDTLGIHSEEELELMKQSYMAQ